VKIDRDSHGNIYLTKLTDCAVIVKGFRDPQNHCIADDVIETSGRVGSERTKVVSHCYLQSYARAVLAVSLCLCICPFVTSQYCIKTAKWIKLVFGIQASFNLLCYNEI